MPLSDQLEKLYTLRRDRSSGREKPYKPALLLALIDGLEQGDFEGNRILLTDQLIQRYKDYLKVVGHANDTARVQYPFWHLCGDGIWQLWDRTGKELYQPGESGSSSPSAKWIRDRLDRATFEPELYAILTNPETREVVRDALISRYFPGQRNLLLKFIHGLSPDPEPVEAKVAEDNPARSAAFAKVVKEVYDYRCAASGLRFRYGDLTIVDACHLIPFARSHNDHPSNGMALSKNHHWALDHYLIALRQTETKLVWMVSPLLDDRIEGHRELLKLDGRNVLLPRERKFHPAEEAIAWRGEQLLR